MLCTRLFQLTNMSSLGQSEVRFLKQVLIGSLCIIFYAKKCQSNLQKRLIKNVYFFVSNQSINQQKYENEITFYINLFCNSKFYSSKLFHSKMPYNIVMIFVYNTLKNILYFRILFSFISQKETKCEIKYFMNWNAILEISIVLQFYMQLFLYEDLFQNK